jgi:small-conductance mechanosensitive channel
MSFINEVSGSNLQREMIRRKFMSRSNVVFAKILFITHIFILLSSIIGLLVLTILDFKINTAFAVLITLTSIANVLLISLELKAKRNGKRNILNILLFPSMLLLLPLIIFTLALAGYRDDLVTFYTALAYSISSLVLYILVAIIIDSVVTPMILVKERLGLDKKPQKV